MSTVKELRCDWADSSKLFVTQQFLFAFDILLRLFGLLNILYSQHFFWPGHTSHESPTRLDFHSEVFSINLN